MHDIVRNQLRQMILNVVMLIHIVTHINHIGIQQIHVQVVVVEKLVLVVLVLHHVKVIVHDVHGEQNIMEKNVSHITIVQ